MSLFKIKSVRLQDVRCFHGETVIFLRNPTIFVGGNDTGKSSIFKILDVFFNKIKIEDNERISIANEYLDYLMPKYCERIHSAKQIKIEIEATDNRSLRGMTIGHSRTANLILTIMRNGVKLELNCSHRGTTSNFKAINLYQRLINNISYAYIPSLRDVASDIFEDNLNALTKKYIYENIYPQHVGGTTAEYRRAKETVTGFKNGFKVIANRELLNFVKKHMPIPALQEILFDFDVDEAQILQWFLKKIKIVRPARGEEKISMANLGTGVLSSLSLAVLLANKISPQSNKLNILAIEEPEAFVHPHHQRNLFDRLVNNIGQNQLLVSTHSPAIIDRQPIGNISLVTRKNPNVGTKIWQVGNIPDVDKEIFSAHANFHNSELFFSDLVILVEGPSEKLVLTYLFDKLPAQLKSLFFGISIVEVGGNGHYGPFIRLLKSFVRSGREYPIKWLLFTDRDSIQPGRTQPVIQALRDSGFSNFSQEEINSYMRNPFVDDADGLQKVRQINGGLNLAKTFVNLADLEYTLLTSSNFSHILRCWNEEKTKRLVTGDLPTTLNKALSYIGSKGLNLDLCPSGTGKRPFIHGKIMQWTKLVDVADILKDFLEIVASELTDNIGHRNYLHQELYPR